ncbi:PfaD family polyunsaturated fatty acid/polyketide biosynthesis protein [Streptomyces sp. TRM 70361]|uniref:PfaD family polyunsaturated fatty acid/polyketide biosynthesis protein n=1 Tax=Streptomyces sp. TRM 70361 TaxID=3116553 RepID=UPI002E7BFA95|nr:PfaD family polyunsaturated fatty acid/polyketide biosynthesis protein [Streptomyces sp. TRM 70361]MEE1940367.1 PfaD family polyunsaturated fatty acid/polyketide biosynthesis protein [Streptomyces sp. TRM 70361]
MLSRDGTSGTRITALPLGSGLRPEDLGSAGFRADHGVAYAYASGSMYKAIASVELVVRMGRAGLLGYFGAGGLGENELDASLRRIRAELGDHRAFGVNLLSSRPEREERTVDALLAHGVRRVEAASFVQITPALVRYRLSGAHRAPDGTVRTPNRVMAKVSRQEVAEAFLAPPPAGIVHALADAGRITPQEAGLAPSITMCDDLCAEADSGGHTDQRPMTALLPAMLTLRDRAAMTHAPAGRVRIGAAGGIGTPEAAAAAFVMGAGFVLTGSINQCTAEAGTSDTAKDLLQRAQVQDTALVPAGDMFEMGTKAQVLRRGLFFPARANKLYELWLRHGSLDELDPDTADNVQRRILGRTFEEVWQEVRARYAATRPAIVERAEQDPKRRMALVFTWYFAKATRVALEGDTDHRVDFQIPCGPALGALNERLRGTPREHWRNRHPDDLARLIMTGAAELLSRVARLTSSSQPFAAA